MNVDKLLSINFNELISSVDNFLESLETGFEKITDSDYGNWNGNAFENYTKVKTSLVSKESILISNMKSLKAKLENISKLVNEYKDLDEELGPLEAKFKSFNNIAELSDDDNKDKNNAKNDLDNKKKDVTRKKSELEDALLSL